MNDFQFKEEYLSKEPFVAAVEICAKAGNEAMNDPTVPWESPFKNVDIACARQIISGMYDNSKVAEKVFVDAVLAKAREIPLLANEPGVK